MSNLVIERGRLTDAFIAYLKDNSRVNDFPLLIGDGDPPAAAGWPGGQAQMGSFVASATVRTMTAAPLHRETVNSRHSSWRCRYAIRTIGAARAQADAGADVIRQVVTDFRALVVQAPTADIKVQDAVYEGLGSVEKRGSGDAATWEVDDVIDLWVVRAVP